MKKVIKDMFMPSGKWSYKRITGAYILNVAIIYALLPIWFQKFNVMEFVFMSLLGYSGTMVGITAWEKFKVNSSQKEEENGN